MSSEYFTVGHITNDLYPFPHVSGGVAYSAYAALKLGYEAHIITKSSPESQYINDLTAMGIIVHCLPNIQPEYKGKITTFQNIFDQSGHRQQVVTEVQESITYDDLKYFPDIPRSAKVLIAPVIGEVTPEVTTALSLQHKLHMNPQGNFRQIDNEGKVRRERWRELHLLILASFIVLSDEDITLSEEVVVDKLTLEKIEQMTKLTVITKGENGSEVIRRSEQNNLHIKPLPLETDEIVDLSGSGDTYATSFWAQYERTHNLLQAGVFASLFAALKIKDLKGKKAGLPTVPSLSDLKNFITENPQRYQRFLKKNNIKSLFGLDF